MSITVNADFANGFPTLDKTALLVRVVTGASAAQPGRTANAFQSAQNLSITPLDTGSWVYGVFYVGTAGATPFDSNTTFEYQPSVPAEVAFRSTNALTAGTPITLGGTGLDGDSTAIALCEIVPSGTLAEDSSSPSGVAVNPGVSVTTASFTPPAGALLVATVFYSRQNIACAVSDSSNLTWTQQVSNGASHGYGGVWTAQVPAPTGPFPGKVTLSNRLAGAVTLGQKPVGSVRLSNRAAGNITLGQEVVQ